VNDPIIFPAYTYKANGMRAAQEFSLEEYVDGEKITPNAVAHDTPEYGDITFAGAHQRARRLQYAYKSACSEFRRVGVKHEIFIKPNQGSRPERLMTERSYEDILCPFGTVLKFALQRNRVIGYDRVTKTTQLGLGDITMSATGPDGIEGSAYNVPAWAGPAEYKCYDLTHPGVAGSASCLILIWTSGSCSLGAYGSPIVTTPYKTYGNWTLHTWAPNMLSADMLQIVQPIGAASQFYALRILGSKVTDANLLADYFRDITLHAGRKYEPRF